MPYYIRVLSPNSRAASLKSIRDGVLSANKAVKLSIAGSEEKWESLVISHLDDTPICEIERNEVVAGKFGEDEIEEFLEAIEGCFPATAVDWLHDYLPKIKTIYAMQIFFEGADRDGGWTAIGAAKDAIHADVAGIIQADGEGFTNENGNHILWQFSESVSGPWWMAIRQNDQWVEFQMELGNPEHRAAFLRGEKPTALKP